MLIIDDHPVFATSLARTLDDEPDIEIAATAGSLDEALAMVDRTIDVALCDYRLGDDSGVQFTTAALAKVPDLKVVMLTATHDEAVLASALDAGCSGFVTKAEPLGTVLAAIRAASSGESVITPALLARLLPRLATKQRGPNPHLTEREHEVLALVVRGHTNSEIAGELGIAVDTARNHVRSILSKLGVHSKLQAAAVAVQRGIAHPSD